MADLIPQLKQTLPAVLQDASEDAADRVIEFFTAEIRNENTRKAYARAVRRFFRRAPSDSSIYPILSRSTSPPTSRRTTGRPLL